MDLKAIKSASRSDLAACAIAAAGNAQGLLQDAELLAGSARMARAYSLAALAVEECGKAMDLTALALMPERLRAQAPVGRMLEWHQLKLVGGLLMAVVPFTSVTSRLAEMPTAELAQTLSILDEPADEADRLKRRGFYVDMDHSGRVRGPWEITESEVESQLGRARRAAASAFVLLSPDAEARLASPPDRSVEFAQELVSALIEAGPARTPKAAADVILQAVDKYRVREAGSTRSLADSAGQVATRPAAHGARGKLAAPVYPTKAWRDRTGQSGYTSPSPPAPWPSASEASDTAIARPSALKMFPPAETTFAVPTTGATPIMTPWTSSAVMPLSAASPALARYEAGGASTDIRAAVLTSISSRGERESCSSEAAVRSTSVSSTGVPAVMDPPRDADEQQCQHRKPQGARVAAEGLVRPLRRYRSSMAPATSPM